MLNSFVHLLTISPPDLAESDGSRVELYQVRCGHLAMFALTDQTLQGAAHDLNGQGSIRG
jgi:hypothetical protein